MSESTGNKDLPKIPTDLLEALERQMPPLRPRVDWTDRRIWIEVGRREFLEMLRIVHDRQREDPTVL